MESNNTAAEESKSRKGWWLWLLLPLLLVGIWWFFPRTTAPKVEVQKAEVKLCTLDKIAPSGHCCTAEAKVVSLYNDGSTLSVSAAFPGQGKLQAPIKAVVLWPTGEVYPTGDLFMAQDEVDTNGCYFALINPVHGVKWTPSKYRVQVLVGDQVVGEQEFEIVK